MRKLFCISALFLSAVTAFAAQPWEGPALSADPQAIRQAAAAISTPNGANVQVLFEQDTYRYEKDGRCTRTYRTVYRVLTAAAVEGWSSLSVNWAPWYQQRPSLRARVINADAVHTLEPATITESPVADED